MIASEENWKFDAFGEAIQVCSSGTKVSDCSAGVVLTRIEHGLVDFMVSIYHLDMVLNKEVEHVEAIWDWTFFNDSRGKINKALAGLTVNSAADEFFCSVTFISTGSENEDWNGTGEIHIAFSEEPYYQFDLGGTIMNPLAMGCYRERLVTVDTNLTATNRLFIGGGNVSLNHPRLIPSNSPQGRINILVHNQVAYATTRTVCGTQSSDSKITTESMGNTAVSSGASVLGVIHPTFYGLVHDVFWGEYNSAPEQVPSWWVQGTQIQQGVYVFKPSKARILSDLQFYNMYFDYSESTSRELWAYELDTEGYGPAPPAFIGSDYAVVTSDDVKAIWGTWGDHNSYPRGTVVLADYCASLLYGPMWYNQMAKAFVNYGASSYVGSQMLGVYAVMDPFTTTFWQSICFQEQTVGQAKYNAETSQYNYLMSIGNPYNLAVYYQMHVAFGIYGSTSKTIP